MTIVFQALIGLALLTGLVAIFLSAKNWHWTQLVLVMFILFAGAGVLYMTAKTLGMQKKLRAEIPRLEKDLARLQESNQRLLKGAGDQKGIRELDHRLQIVLRERGRVWRQVQPAGQLSQDGNIAIEIPHPQPHGLEENAIVFAFETGPPNAAAPQNGPQYLGEFLVKKVSAGGATLETIHLLNPRSGERIARSKGPWSLYETMPVDRHKLFAGFSEEQLRQMLPAQSVDEYLRHGSPATADDDEWHVIGLDENDERVGPENIDQAVKKLYDRPLRDYAYLFSELAEQRVVMLASIQAVTEDNKRMEVALKSAEQLGEFREAEKEALAQNLLGMQRDREAIESHRDLLQTLLQKTRTLIAAKIAENSDFARRYTETQMELMRQINSSAPPPGGASFTSP
ncbi:MAG: phage holin family protein [Pirellulales bacterium]|nr:phage holin family protein [Pirellulales bacterium]